MTRLKPYIIFPTEAESQGTKCAMEDMTVSGIGCAAVAAATARAIFLYGSERLYVLAGIAGQYDGDMAPGTVVSVATERLSGHLTENDTLHLSYVPEEIPHCDSITVTENGYGYGKGMIENMEGAAFVSVCRALCVKCAEIRAISNTVGDPRNEWHVNEAIANLNEFLNEKIL